MNDGREHIGHHPTCNAPDVVVERARVMCRDCGRFAPRTDVPPGVCRDCGGTCRPDMPVCARCAKATKQARAEPIQSPAVTIPAATSRRYVGMVCRGCHKPVTVKVKPGRGFVCPCSATKAKA
jgi:hypothetical protein